MTLKMNTDEGGAMLPARAGRERSLASRLRPADEYRYRGPSHGFISLTRNVSLAENAPTRFEPTVKREGDIVL